MERAVGSLLRGCRLLRRTRVSWQQLKPLEEAAGRTAGMAWKRLLSEEAHSHGTYLSKHEVTDRVLNVVKTFPKVDASKVSTASNFQKDLGLDSLDTVEVVMGFEEEFALEIPDSEADKIASCADAIEYIASHPQAK